MQYLITKNLELPQREFNELDIHPPSPVKMWLMILHPLEHFVSTDYYIAKSMFPQRKENFILSHVPQLMNNPSFFHFLLITVLISRVHTFSPVCQKFKLVCQHSTVYSIDIFQPPHKAFIRLFENI